MRRTKFQNIVVLGITGGVGAGKSTVLRELHDRLHAYVIECDQVGRELQAEGGACYGPMVSLFGTGILYADGSIDRSKVAKLIYGDMEKKEALEHIVLPKVKAEVRRMLEEFDRSCGINSACLQPSPRDPASGQRPSCSRLAVVEAALLIDDHYEELCDEIWYVYTAEEKRRQRLKKSRGYSDGRIDRMFKAQRSDASFRAHTQYTIDNTDDFVQNTYEQLQEGLKEHFPELFDDARR